MRSLVNLVIFGAAVALVGLMLWSTPGVAREGCAPIATLIEGLSEHPGYIMLPALTPEQIAQAVQMWNETPPASDVKFTYARLVKAPEGGVLLLGFDDEVCVGARMDEDRFHALKKFLLGEDA